MWRHISSALWAPILRPVFLALEVASHQGAGVTAQTEAGLTAGTQAGLTATTGAQAALTAATAGVGDKEKEQRVTLEPVWRPCVPHRVLHWQTLEELARQILVSGLQKRRYMQDGVLVREVGTTCRVACACCRSASSQAAVGDRLAAPDKGRGAPRQRCFMQRNVELA